MDGGDRTHAIAEIVTLNGNILTPDRVVIMMVETPRRRVMAEKPLAYTASSKQASSV